MTRILLLVPLLTWLIWRAEPHAAPPSIWGTAVFFGGYAALILLMAVWARLVARRVDTVHLQRHLWRFNWMMLIARILVAKWFFIALFGGLGWGRLVMGSLSILNRWPLILPPAVIATLPAYFAWMGLWWAQYPAERALREQNVLDQLDNDLPVRNPPGFWSYFFANLRLQILFTVVPVMLILLLRDVTCMVLWSGGWIARDDSKAEPMILLASSLLVFLIAPLFLKIILRTQPLPDSSLRQRLEALCLRSRLRYREILLWNTDHNMGNAAVMGLLPQVRYILLSDLLLETMSDEQIEAVFAHELGHIVHRHMAWYVVLVMILMLGMSVGEVALERHMSIAHAPGWIARNIDVLLNVAGVGAFFWIFGILSRRFERQADVYAARTMEKHGSALDERTQGTGFVGPYGATIFSSALYRVAVVNNIPISAWNFSHGSIAKRMNYLKRLSDAPERTDEFDRLMFAIYALMLATVVLFLSLAYMYRAQLMA